MPEAYIIDAVRTPRSIGKVGKGALAGMHPEHLTAIVMKAIAERNHLDTRDIDDVIWGVGAPMGKQGSLARMSALDADFDVSVPGIGVSRFWNGRAGKTRSSWKTITTVNFTTTDGLLNRCRGLIAKAASSTSELFRGRYFHPCALAI